MAKKQIILFTLLLTLFFLGGCQKQPEQTNPPDSEPALPAATMTPTGPQIISDPLLVDDYMPLSLPEEPADYTERRLLTDSYGNILYLFAVYSFAETADNYVLYQFDADTREIQGSPFSFSTPGWENLTILSVDAIDKNTLSFRIEGTHTGSDSPTAFLYRSTSTGQPLQLKSSLPDPEEYPWNPEFGTFYVYDSPYADTYIVKWNSDTGTCDLFRHDPAALLNLPVCSLPAFPHSLCAVDANTLYYTDSRHIVRYDLAQEQETYIASLTDCGISDATFSHLLLDSYGQLTLVILQGGIPGIYFLAPGSEIQPEASQETLRLVNLTPYSCPDYIAQLAAILSVRSKTLEIEVTKQASDPKAYRDRILAELMTGEGPELMCATKSDLALLSQKGLLADLSQLLPPEDEAPLFKSLLQLGTVENTLTGLPLDITFDTLVVSSSQPIPENWTTQDMITLLNTGKYGDSPILLYGRRATAYELLSRVFFNDLSKSPYLDFEQGICYFDSEEFIQLLEYCKKFGDKEIHADYLKYQNSNDWLAEGKILTQGQTFYEGLPQFSRIMNSYGQELYLIGYPQTGHQAISTSYLVVNAKAAQSPGVKEYLQFLLNYENQYTLLQPLRRDVYENRLTRDPISGLYYMPTTLDNSHSYSMEPKPDGSSYLEDYLAFIDSIQVTPNYHPTITSILGDELDAYLNNDRSARETAAIIQNRVQLYLDENAQ